VTVLVMDFAFYRVACLWVWLGEEYYDVTVRFLPHWWRETCTGWRWEEFELRSQVQPVKQEAT